MWSTPTFWRTTVFTKARQFFSKLLDVRPKDKNDYYGIGRWLVSKRLAFALIAVVGILCIAYIDANVPQKASDGNAATLHTYKYNSLPLKFYNGTVNILAKNGHLAYTGQVSKGAVNGNGILYAKDGTKVYEGAFSDNKYNGAGQLYYGSGVLEYNGDFSENQYQGKGSFYRPTGTLEYTGDYESGHRSGQGQLYSSTGNLIYTGTFSNDRIVYNELLSKATKAIASMYTGASSVFSTSDEYCVSMDDIGAVYAAQNGEDTLSGDWSVNDIYVLSGEITIGGTCYKSINALTKALGQPDYFGTSSVNLPEAICINKLIDNGNKDISAVSVTSGSAIQNVNSVTDYDSSASVYLYSYISGGLQYTFYATGAGSDSFVMYSIQSDNSSDKK